MSFGDKLLLKFFTYFILLIKSLLHSLVSTQGFSLSGGIDSFSCYDGVISDLSGSSSLSILSLCHWSLLVSSSNTCGYLCRLNVCSRNLQILGSSEFWGLHLCLSTVVRWLTEPLSNLGQLLQELVTHGGTGPGSFSFGSSPDFCG